MEDPPRARCTGFNPSPAKASETFGAQSSGSHSGDDKTSDTAALDGKGDTALLAARNGDQGVNPVPEMVDADKAGGSRLLTGPTGFTPSMASHRPPGNRQPTYTQDEVLPE